jgi:hypothetical protein
MADIITILSIEATVTPIGKEPISNYNLQNAKCERIRILPKIAWKSCKLLTECSE